MATLLFIIDPWDKLKVSKDSSLAMMRVALDQGFQVEVALAETLVSPVQQPIGVTAHRLISAGTVGGEPLAVQPSGFCRALPDYAAVVMRKDPPFNLDYVTALWLLRRAVQQGARVVNEPTAVLNHNEKLSILEFAEHTPPTIIAHTAAEVAAFMQVHHDLIVKPLNGMGGAGIFRLREGEVNFNAIIETLLEHEPAIMVQAYLPAIAEGDKRVFVLNGVVQPYTLARIPKAGETRGNLAAGGQGVAMPITEAERTVAEALAPILKLRGLTLVGLDMIGGRLTEMNVTSPTCMVEIESQTGYPMAEHALAAIVSDARNE